jgi:hypothetical protein
LWAWLFWDAILLSLLAHKGYLPLKMSSVAVDSLRPFFASCLLVATVVYNVSPAMKVFFEESFLGALPFHYYKRYCVCTSPEGPGWEVF